MTGWGGVGGGGGRGKEGGERTEELVKEEGRVEEGRGVLEDGAGVGRQRGKGGGAIYQSSNTVSHYLPRIFQEIEVIPNANLYKNMPKD